MSYRRRLTDDACVSDVPVLNHGRLRKVRRTVSCIGEHPDIAGLYVNSGHYVGVTMGLGSGQMLTDVMLGKPPCIDPTPYRLDAVRTPTAEWD